MGASKSKEAITDRQSMKDASGKEVKLQQQIFAHELKMLTSLVSAMITKDDKFVNSKYDFLKPETCDAHTMILASQLESHLKIELTDLHDSIYFSPTEQSVFEKKGKFHKKSDVCKVIATHYTRILKLISLVKAVYDVEHQGDNSLAGIVLSNFKKTTSNRQELLQIYYCDAIQTEPREFKVFNKGAVELKQAGGKKQKQKHKQCGGDVTLAANADTTAAASHSTAVGALKSKNAADLAVHSANTTIDMSNLFGMKLFCEFLSTDERNVFLKTLYWIFERHEKTVEEIGSFMKCATNNVTMFTNVLKKLKLASVKCTDGGEQSMQSLMQSKTNVTFDFHVLDKNPMLHNRLCPTNLQSMVVAYAEVKVMYEKIRNDYVENLDAVVETLTKVVKYSGAKKTYELENVSADTLSKIEDEIKALVATFYLQSILNYRTLFEYLEKNPDKVIISQVPRSVNDAIIKVL